MTKVKDPLAGILPSKTPIKTSEEREDDLQHIYDTALQAAMQVCLKDGLGAAIINPAYIESLLDQAFKFADMAQKRYILYRNSVK